MNIINRFRNREEKKVAKADKVWLQSIIKRQRMVLEDISKFSDIYTDKVDREVVGSLYAIYETLRDMSESIIYEGGATPKGQGYLGLEDLTLRVNTDSEPREYVGLEDACLFRADNRPNYRY